MSINGWFEHILSLLPGSQLSWAGGCLPPHSLCPSHFTASWGLEEAVLMLVWVCLPMAGRIRQGKEKMQLALGKGTAPGIAVLVHLITRGGPCKHCCNWRRRGEQSQGEDLQASANLLCGRADCCSFILCRQSWQASTGGGFNLIFMAGRLSPVSHPVLCCSQGAGGWLGTQAGLVALPWGS